MHCVHRSVFEDQRTGCCGASTWLKLLGAGKYTAKKSLGPGMVWSRGVLGPLLGPNSRDLYRYGGLPRGYILAGSR
jgi:hypothetical protein